ncbi:MAG: hypothetical protein WBW14_09365 [Candidatus Acidiferrum sp.]
MNRPVPGANGHPSVKRLRYIIVILYGLMFFDARSACPTASSAGSRAYRGREIKQAITDFYRSAAGLPTEEMPPGARSASAKKDFPATAALSVYVGHDGLMDFAIENRFQGDAKAHREAIILACASKMFFASGLKTTGAQPLLWTTGLMAPEAYTLKAALDGWIAGESAVGTRERAAAAYAKYQKCSMTAAQKLFTSGW